MKRRSFIKNLGISGASLNSITNSRASTNPMAPHIAPRAKNVIFLFMCGGASHLETFDHKPVLKKHAGKKASEIFSKEDLDGFNPEKSFENSRIIPPVFDFKQYGQSGSWVSEIYPKLSEVVDDICFIKSLHTDSAIHSVGETLMHTGHERPGFPSLGSWVTYGLGSKSSTLPPYVVMKDGISTAGDIVFQQGMLPGRHRASVAAAERGKPPFPYLSPDPKINKQDQYSYLKKLQQLNKAHQKKHIGQPELMSRIESFEMAFDLQSSAKAAFDLNRESKSIHKLYGENLFSRQCLTARRLIESGVRFVEILDGAEGRKWDAHGNRGGLVDNHRNNAARTDQGIAALITDLKSRGMLDETLIVWATEFGRTPFEEERKKKSELGRGHHHKGFTLWMAGGGVKGGTSHGQTDELGMYAVKDPVSFHDFHATILHLLGLNHEQLTYRHNSRDLRLTDVFGNVLHDIIA
ncbi:DUF1501 domain-containing protein [Verrucomicrobiales bacterium]|nr:DUF1501 domain-containing protein [Verrucomicrobiales bacterium]